jgi:hypothetical protein
MANYILTCRIIKPFMHTFLQQVGIGSIVPLGRGYFPHDSRHFVPGLEFGHFEKVALGKFRGFPMAQRAKIG